MHKPCLQLILGSLLLSTACGPEFVNRKLPKNVISPLQSNEIDETLKMFEQDFSEIGIQVDLHRLPIMVSKIDNLGECHFDMKNNPRAIILNPRLFTDKTTELVEKEFVAVLLHEIGHCYFGRKHVKNYRVTTGGKTISLPGETYVPGWGPDRVIIHDGGLGVSVMGSTVRMLLPKVLRKYYVAEVAGKDKATTIEDLRKYTDYEILENGTWHARMKEVELDEGEAKILYPCSVADLLPLTHEKHKSIHLSKRGNATSGSDGVIYRYIKSNDEESFTLKTRKLEQIVISEVGHNYLKSASGKFKCELDVTYDEESPEFHSSCSYKGNGEDMLKEHYEFLRIMKQPFLGRAILREAHVQATKWKLKTEGLVLEPSVEMWRSENTCLLEVSAKFVGKEKAIPTLLALKELIPVPPSPQQGNKTNQVLEAP